MNKRELEKIENQEMMEQLQQIAKGIRMEIRERARSGELDQYIVKELLK